MDNWYSEFTEVSINTVLLLYCRCSLEGTSFALLFDTVCNCSKLLDAWRCHTLSASLPCGTDTDCQNSFQILLHPVLPSLTLISHNHTEQFHNPHTNLRNEVLLSFTAILHKKTLLLISLPVSSTAKFCQDGCAFGRNLKGILFKFDAGRNLPSINTCNGLYIFCSWGAWWLLHS